MAWCSTDFVTNRKPDAVDARAVLAVPCDLAIGAAVSDLEKGHHELGGFTGRGLPSFIWIPCGKKLEGLDVSILVGLCMGLGGFSPAASARRMC